MIVLGKQAGQDQSHGWWQRVLVASLAIGMLLTTALTAATKAERRQQAEQLVKQALHNEVYGGLTERSQLLKSARQIDAQYAPAQWHQGCVQYQKQWVDAEQLPALLKEDPFTGPHLEAGRIILGDAPGLGVDRA